MAKDLAIVLNNGSINSAVVTSLAAQKYRPILVYADIGRGSNAKNRIAYEQQLEHFKPYREHSLELPFLKGLTDNAAAADPRMAGAQAQQRLELLPLVAIATRLGAHYQAAAVYVGLRVGPGGDELAAATEYGQIWNEMLQISCGQHELELVLPILELEAWQVVDLGYQVSAPLERTWSCMDQGSEPCSGCRACRSRQAAFAQTSRADPLLASRKN